MPIATHNVSMNKLAITDRVAILKAITEGCSLRSTSRMTGVAFNTVVKLLLDAGEACEKYQHEVMRNLSCRKLQLDEVWSFVAAKEKNVSTMKNPTDGAGSIWTWSAIDAESKLVPCWLVGLRDGEHARAFVSDLASRLAHRVQITTDGLKAYLEAMEAGFGGEVDYAVLHKVYGGATVDESRYSPADCVGCEKIAVSGNPDPASVSTSFVERQNLTLRMRNRRFTRLTNAFSKRLANHEKAVALSFFAYNFIFRHRTLRMPPALKAGVTDHWWTYEELVELIDRMEVEKKNKNPN
jgi:IS1 family transposase